LNALVKHLAGCLVLATAPITAATAVAAHPHVLVDAKATIVFDPQGRISAVSNVWEFDEAFTAFAIEGLDKNGDGKLSGAELAPLAKINIDSLKEYDYFTYLLAGDTKNVFATPTKYWLEYHNSRLTLFFTLPLENPVPVDGIATVEIFDPEYFVAFTFVKDHPVGLQAAPQGCTAAYQPPHEIDAETMNALAAIPMDQHDLPPDLLKVAVRLANLVKINCEASGAAVAQAASGRPTQRLSPLDSPGGAHGTLTPPDPQLSLTNAPKPSPAPPPATDATGAPPATSAVAAPPTPPSGDVIATDFGDKLSPAAPMQPGKAPSASKAAPTAAAASVATRHPSTASASRLFGLIGLFVALLAAIAGGAILLQRKLRRA
jgi:ABC-type uncharacterized transport system substrate-binding protein